jgi:ribose 5-phosphate isomerase B
MNIHIATDHAGFEMKEFVKKHLVESGNHVTDHGAFTYDSFDDYPDFITPCAVAVADDTRSLGIIFGGSGQGEQITANKIDGIRAIEYYGGNLEIIKLGREHNNANILSIGARFITNDQAIAAIQVFLNTSFSENERHIRRIDKMKSIKNIFRNFLSILNLK